VFTVAGFVVSVAVGLLVLVAFHGAGTVVGPSTFAGLATVEVVAYNVLWFAIPLGAFAVAVRSPGTARAIEAAAGRIGGQAGHQER
jgi:hypothetical protein